MCSRATAPSAPLRPHYDLRCPTRRRGSYAPPCRATFPNHYVKVLAFDASRGWETPRMAYLVHRPAEEPGFGLAREEGPGRTQRYRIVSYAAERPEGERY